MNEDRLIIALDTHSVNHAWRIVHQTRHLVSYYKVGPALLIAPGAEAMIDRLIQDNIRVFLDAKLHDIPNTIALSVKQAVSRGLRSISVHAYQSLITAALQARGNARLSILAVTTLTSADTSSKARTEHWAKTDADGIICPVSEIPQEGLKVNRFYCPGIRPHGFYQDDHTHYSTPTAAIAAGADYLIVGRPIINSDQPGGVTQHIINAMNPGIEGFGP